MMLWNGLATRNFEQFWTVNRQLMDCNTANQSSGYKHLPIRVYKTDRSYSQPLVPADQETGNTVKDLLDLCAIDLDTEMLVISQGIEVPLDSNVCEITQSLSSFDNFLYLCTATKVAVS